MRRCTAPLLAHSTRCHCCPRWPTSWWSAPCATPTSRGSTGSTGCSAPTGAGPSRGAVHRGIAAGVYGGLGARPARHLARRSARPPTVGSARGWDADRAGPVRQPRGQRPDRRPAGARAAAARDPDGGPGHDGDDVVPDRPGAGRGVPRRHRTGRGLPPRPVRERVLLEPAPRAARHDVRRGAGRRTAGPRSSCAPTPGCRCARTASRSRPSSATWSTRGRCTSSGSRWWATRWAAW